MRLTLYQLWLRSPLEARLIWKIRAWTKKVSGKNSSLLEMVFDSLILSIIYAEKYGKSWKYVYFCKIHNFIWRSVGLNNRGEGEKLPCLCEFPSERIKHHCSDHQACPRTKAGPITGTIKDRLAFMCNNSTCLELLETLKAI